MVSRTPFGKVYGNLTMSTTHRVEPLIYESIVVTEHRSARLLQSFAVSTKPLSFYHNSIKHLDIGKFDLDATDATDEAILSRCRGVTRIEAYCYFWRRSYSARAAELLSEMRPKHFSSMLTDLLQPGLQDFSAPFFSQITHLDIIDPFSRWGTWSGFDHLPHLTHLCLSYSYEDTAQGGGRRALRRILSQCPHLQICVLDLEIEVINQPAWKRTKYMEDDLMDGLDTEDDRLAVLWPTEVRPGWPGLPRGQGPAGTWDGIEARVVRVRPVLCDPESDSE